jgi:hypothetical protein
MKKLKIFVIMGLLIIATLLSVPNNAFAQTTTANTGNQVTNDLRTGQFSVPANLDAGVNFTNQIKQEVSVTFSTEGTWSVSKDNKGLQNLSANGFASSYLGETAKYLKYPNTNAFSLLAVNKNSNPPTIYQVGGQSTITLAPGATLTFFINETTQTDTYNDNTGSIIVKWSVISTNKPDLESAPAPAPAPAPKAAPAPAPKAAPPVVSSDLMINLFSGKTFEITAAGAANGVTTAPYSGTPANTRQISFRNGASGGFTHLSFNSGCGFYEIDLRSQNPVITPGKSLRWPVTFDFTYPFNQGGGGYQCSIPYVAPFNTVVIGCLQLTFGNYNGEIAYNVGDSFITLRSVTSPVPATITMNIPPDVKASLENLINQ